MGRKALGQHPALQCLEIRVQYCDMTRESEEFADLLTGLSTSHTLRKLKFTSAFPWRDDILYRSLGSAIQRGVTDLHVCLANDPEDFRAIIGLLHMSSDAMASIEIISAFRDFDLTIKLGLVQDLLQRRSNSLKSFSWFAYEGIVLLSTISNIMESLSGNTQLRSFSLTGIRLQHDTAPYRLLQALGKNYHMSSLTLGNYPDKSEDGHKSASLFITVDAFVAMNAAGRRYCLDDPRNKRKGVKVLEAAQNVLSCLFCHLRENPYLCFRAK